MARLCSLFKCAILLFLVDSTIVKFSVFANGTSTLSKSFEVQEVVPDLLPKAPSDVAHVQYSSGVSANLGNVLTPTQVKDSPSIQWEADPNHFYTLAMTGRYFLSRGMFSIIEFAKKYKLGDPVAGNFYQAVYDNYVPEMFKQLKQKYNL